MVEDKSSSLSFDPGMLDQMRRYPLGGSRDDYENGSYAGTLSTYENCGGTDTSVISLTGSAWPPS